jgi:hypothetical protein
MFRPQVEDGRHPDSAVVCRSTAELRRRVRRDGSQGLAELTPQMGLTWLHDPDNGRHGSIDEHGRDRRL